MKPSAFRMISSEDRLHAFHREPIGDNVACARCGVRPFARGDIPEIGGPYVSINVRCLDGVDLSGVKISCSQ